MVGEVIGRDMVKNPDNYFKTMKEAGVYELASAWGIWMPAYDTTRVWWPWLKNYGGVSNGGYDNRNDWTKYAWIDQALKKSMGR